jgi:decaprenylphosphoryl-5-phosphoribose phosphatase
VLRSLDLALLRLLRTRGHAAPAERSLLMLARAGQHGLLWYGVAAGGAALDPARRGLYLRGIRVTLMAFAANQAIKLAVRRRRPRLPDLPPLTSTLSQLSYPSAHAATSFAAARSLSAPLPAPALYLTATAMALTRPYLGVHYPSDTLAGAVLGDAVARLAP